MIDFHSFESIKNEYILLNNEDDKPIGCTCCVKLINNTYIYINYDKNWTIKEVSTISLIV